MSLLLMLSENTNDRSLQEAIVRVLQSPVYRDARMEISSEIGRALNKPNESARMSTLALALDGGVHSDIYSQTTSKATHQSVFKGIVFR